MKTNKLRRDFEKLMEDTTLVTAIQTDGYGGYYQKDVDRIWKFIETAIQAEKKKWIKEGKDRLA